MWHIWGDRKGAYRVCGRVHRGKEPLGKCRCLWEGNIKMDLQELELQVMDWIDLNEDGDRWQVLVNALMDH
jgi:hypothetical protein